MNDTDHFQSTHKIEITNSGDEQITYQLTHRTEPTYFSRNAVTGNIDSAPPHSTDSADLAVVQLSTSEVTIAPGQTASIEVTFAEPAASDANGLPVYGGGIDISGSNGERLSVSYMGKLFSLAHSWVILLIILYFRHQRVTEEYPSLGWRFATVLKSRWPGDDRRWNLFLRRLKCSIWHIYGSVVNKTVQL